MGRTALFLTATVCTFLLGVAPALAQVDAEAAQALAKRNDCFKCHAIDKAKKSPAYKKIADRLRGKPGVTELLVEHVTTGPRVRLEDGTYENHRFLDTKDPEEIRNLVRWILSL